MTNYISPRQLAAAVGVSESSIKRWVDAGRIDTILTAGGHRRIPLAASIRFVRDSGKGLIDARALGASIESVDAQSCDGGETVPPLFDHLRYGRTQDALALVRGLYVSGMETADIIDGPFRQAMYRFGTMWHDQPEESVFLEHRATQIGLRILLELRTIQGVPASTGPLALGGAPPGDPYLLPTLAVATVLESIGFSCSNLGPETPDSAFVHAIDTLRPRLVWLSVTHARKPTAYKQSILALGEAARRVGANLVIGGQQSDLPGTGNSSLAYHGRTMVELAAFAKGILQSQLSAAGGR